MSDLRAKQERKHGVGGGQRKKVDAHTGRGKNHRYFLPTNSCFWCVIRIIGGVFSLFVLVSFEISEVGCPAVRDLPTEKDSATELPTPTPDPLAA